MKNLSIRGDHETILKAREFLVSNGVCEDKKWNDSNVDRNRSHIIIFNGACDYGFALHNHEGVWTERDNACFLEITPENYESVLTELINDGSITAGSKQ